MKIINTICVSTLLFCLLLTSCSTPTPTSSQSDCSNVTTDSGRFLEKKGVYGNINDCIFKDVSHWKSSNDDGCGAFEESDTPTPTVTTAPTPVVTATPVANNTHEEQIAPIPNENENTDDQTPTASTSLANSQSTCKIGYNSYGIPGASMWQLYKDQPVLELKDNVDEIVIDIKNKLNIPQCITGIPFDERAKELLIDDNGDLVSNWEGILEQLKSEWPNE